MTKKNIPTKTPKAMEVVEKATKMQSHSPLFKHLEDEHGLILVESEIREIEIIIGRMYEEPKTENEFLHYTLVNLLRLGEPAMRHIYDSLGARLVRTEEVTWEQFMLAYAQSATSLTFVHWAMNENYKLIKK